MTKHGIMEGRVDGGYGIGGLSHNISWCTTPLDTMNLAKEVWKLMAHLYSVDKYHHTDFSC